MRDLKHITQVLPRLLCVGLLATLWFFACSSKDDTDDSAARETDASVGGASGAVAATDTAPVRARPAFDVAATLRRVKLSFREDGDRFSAGTLRHAVEASEGLVRFRTYHFRDRQGRPLDATHARSAMVEVETVGIERGGRPIALSRPRGMLHDGALLIDRGAVIERVDNRDASVEQSWRFEERPAGSGPLVVSVALGGATFTETTDTGLHFSDRESGVGVRYSHATWKPANGDPVAIPARWQDGRIVLEIPEAVVAKSAFPAVLDPTISGEIETDAPVVGPAYNLRFAPKVATNGTRVLAVWEDYRMNLDSPIRSIMGARLTTTGALVDPTGFMISDGEGNASQPDVSSDGSDFVVAWVHGDPITGDDEVRVARVDAAGAIVDVPGVTLESVASTDSIDSPRIASRGTQHLVVWTHDTGIAAINLMGARITTGAGLTVLDATPNTLVSRAGLTNPDVASNGTDYMVVWEDVSEGVPQVYGWPISGSNGLPFNGELELVTDASADGGVDDFERRDPAIAWDGGSFYLVVWAQTVTGSDVRIRAGRLFNNDTVWDPAGFSILSTADTVFNSPAVAWNGSNHTVVAQDATNGFVVGKIIDSSMADVAGPTIVDSASVIGTIDVIGFNDGATDTSLVTWEESFEDVYAARLANNGIAPDTSPIDLNQSGITQRTSDVAFNGTHHLLVWWEHEPSSVADGYIYGMRVLPDGTAVDTTPFVIESDYTISPLSPRVASDGVDWLVVYASDALGDIISRRVSAAGAVSNPTLVSGGNGFEDEPAVGWANENYVIAYRDTETGNSEVFAARVSPTNTVVGSEINISNGAPPNGHPTVACTGPTCIIAFHNNGNTQMRFRRLSTTGVLLDGVSHLFSSPGVGLRANPNATTDGSNFFVVWADSRAGGPHVYGNRIQSSDAMVLDGDGFLVSEGAGIEWRPDVVWDGSNFLTTYARSATGGDDIYGVRHDATGSAVDPSPFVISGDPEPESLPAVGTSGGGNGLVSYTGFEPGASYSTTRVLYRTFAAGAALGTTCASGAECDSGYCVDGVCCDSACGATDGGSTSGDCQACSIATGASQDGTCEAFADGTFCDDGDPCTSGDGCFGGVCSAGCFARAFVTSLTYTGSQVGTGGPGPLETADSHCQSLADGQALGGTWKALLSDSSLSPLNTFTQLDVPYVRLDGVTLANNFADLFDTTIQNTLSINELGGNNPANVWTGTLGDGTRSGNNCSNWSSNSSTVTGTIGSNNQTTGGWWLVNGSWACDGAYSLYCFEQTVQCDGAGTVDCDDGNPCTADSCDSITGCVHTPLSDGASCGDGTFCNGDEVCTGGECAPGTAPSCDDTNPCTTDTCSATTDACVNTPVSDGTACGDGDRCNGDETCQAGTCAGGTPLDCDDGNICTDDSCDTLSGCQYVNNTSACDDGDACTSGDLCSAGSCSPGEPLNCDDGNVCTDDSCDRVTGCTNTFNTNPCDDGSLCTEGDSCSDGTCVGFPVSCDDANECTDDSCDPALGCENIDNNAPCDDGDVCTVGDICALAACSPGGSTLDCSDGLQCTDDLCDPASGCFNVASPNGTPCDDGLACSTADQCTDGVCSGTGADLDGDTFTDVNCGGTDCNDNDDTVFPNAAELCDGQDNDCDDVTPANEIDDDLDNYVECIWDAGGWDGDVNVVGGDDCNDAEPAQFPGNPEICDTLDNDCNTLVDEGGVCLGNPGDACTEPADCQSGFCVDGVCCLDGCNGGDPNDCTACNVGGSLGTCSPLPDATACDDGAFCNGTETCTAGVCGNSSGDPCPGPNGDANCAESCNEATRTCTANDPDASACDDGLACTTGDACTAGTCAGTAPDLDSDTFVDVSCGGTDCNDNDDTVFPNAAELCDGQDNDCDDVTPANEIDDDLDNYVECTWDAGGWDGDVNVVGGDDCNDAEAASFPGNPEICDGIDNDCVNGIDDGGVCLGNPGDACTEPADCQSGFCVDGVCCLDGCNGGAPNDCTACNVAGSLGTCSPLPDATACEDGLFCNGAETCAAGVCGNSTGDPCPGPNGDANCAESCDETADTCTANDPDTSSCDDGAFCNGTETCTAGVCGDSTGDPCPGPNGDANCAESCNEATRTCTANDPDASACDDGLACTTADLCTAGTCSGTGPDLDADTFVDASCGGTDCNDNDDTVFPTAAELCDGQDNNCDDVIPTNETDDDLDNYVECTWDAGGWDGDVNVVGGGDCNDAEPASFPGNTEICDSIDNDCVNGVDDGDVCGLPDGTACSLGTDCASGNCVDGVCCDTACGGGVSTDCQACSIAAGGSVDGVCGVADGTVCRPVAGVCDVEELCDGSTTVCPTDAFAQPTVECNPSGGACDPPEFCSGTDAVCPSDVKDTAGVACPDDGEVCTLDQCDGVSDFCQHPPATDGTTCDDGDACTTADSCVAGGCTGGTTTDCDDLDPCTADSCDAVSGCVHTPTTGNACDDGNACTTGDTCDAGVCTGGTAPNCDDLNPCTDDSCDGALGCVHTDNTAPCSDGDACTTGDVCSGGVCTAGTLLTCDDGNLCTTDTCDAALGCQFTDNTDPCDDGNACTTGDACAGGTCAPGTPITCDDTNVCTDDSCDPATGCMFVDNTAPCDDGDACTLSDVCAGGICGGGATASCDDANICTDDSCDVATGCINAPNTAPCDDADACTEGDVCAGGACTSGAPLVCDDTNECTSDSCDTALGCVFTSLPDGTTCTNDGNVCTVDTCQGGACNTPVPSGSVQCRAPSCNGLAPDAIAVAEEFCDGTATCPPETQISCGSLECDGTACQNGCSIDADCPLGQFCSVGVCTDQKTDGGTCTRAAMCASNFCVDGFCCNTDCAGGTTDCQSCAVAGLEGTCSPQTGTVCNDGTACTSTDTCDAGTCTGTALNCDDGNPCTADSCDPQLGCQNIPVADGTTCDDGDVCTQTDTCSAGACTGENPQVCDDGNPCTVDSCDPTGGCQTVPLADGTTCDDGDACTVGDSCAAGACQAGTPQTCDDGNVCTTDTCDTATGCVFIDNTDPCDDGNACTTGDTCNAGSCAGGSAVVCDDGNTCTSDSCNTTSGCVFTGLTGTACDDGNACTTGDTCNAGSCTAGTPTTCSDGNVCTDDSCDPLTGCVFTDNTAPCDDGDACTTSDTCSAGACLGGATRSCNDGNVCTNDACDPISGCVFDNNAAACDDGNPCTEGDVCAFGACTGGTATNCDDLNPCTTDSCSVAAGCQHTNNSLPCDDGSACTTGDTCQLGSCQAGSAVVCDDSNTCTDDSCDPATGCVFTDNTAPCDDGVGCTISDTCTGGSCSGTPSDAACDDGNECTSNLCDPSADCTTTTLPDGTTCTNDGNLCTYDECRGGVCNAPVPAGSVECAPASCAASPTFPEDTALSASLCDGSGSCSQQTQTTCSPGRCDVTGTFCESGCLTDADCPSAFFCSGGECLADQGPGATCTTASQCASGFCVDGVCCSSACTGTCQACRTTMTGAANGTCAPVAAGSDPRNDCSDQGAASCGTTGACNGSGACQLYAAGTACGPDFCFADDVVEQACDGSGACVSSNAETCTPFACKSGQCRSGCTTNTDCSLTAACIDGTCQPKKGDGATCSASSECASGYCVDGVCCNSACTGLCRACSSSKKGSGQDGVCGPVGSGADPDSECRAEAASSCGQTGACNGSGACALHPEGTVCDDAFCATTSAQRNEKTCDGGGNCRDRGTTLCEPYLCTTQSCDGSCQSDEDCTPGATCGGNGVCVVDPSLGGPCTTGADCDLGFCVDGVCCNSACDGSCEGCSSAVKGGGSDGLCGPVASGSDPDAECSASSPDSCGQDGACDGAGACRLYDAGTVCGRALCVGPATEAIPDLCDGLGACVESGVSACDSGFACIGFSCRTSCDSDVDCTGAHHCEASECVPDLPIGAPCTVSGHCQSNACVDGVCCDTTCSGECEACSAAKKGVGADGVCEPVAPGTDPDSECAAASDACGAPGTCNGVGACRQFAPPSTPCGATTCSGTSVTGSLCDGAGACAQDTTDCTPFLCAGEVCGTACASDADCAATAFCTSAGTCAEKRENGESCDLETQCASGNCIDGFCCDTSCEGQCEACDVPSAPGTCTPVNGAPHGLRPACAGEGTLCEGRCDGQDATACAYPGALVTCGQATCDDAAVTLFACDGAGACTDTTTLDCAPFGCGEGECLITCTADEQCAQGYICVEGACRAPEDETGCVDAVTLKAADGTVQSCAPFVCVDDACKTACETDDDCAGSRRCEDATCVVDTFDGETPPVISDEFPKGSCGCRAVGADGERTSGLWAAALVGLLAAARRRRSAARAERV